MRLTNPTTEMERDMLRLYDAGGELTFVRWSHGLVIVRDEHGGLWHVHPEALDDLPEEAYPDGTPLAPGDSLADNPQGGWRAKTRTTRIPSTSFVHAPGFLRHVRRVYRDQPKVGLRAFATVLSTCHVVLAVAYLEGIITFTTEEMEGTEDEGTPVAVFRYDPDELVEALGQVCPERRLQEEVAR